MKKSKCTEEQIAFALRLVETGTRAKDICRTFRLSQATFWNIGAGNRIIILPDSKRLYFRAAASEAS